MNRNMSFVLIILLIASLLAGPVLVAGQAPTPPVRPDRLAQAAEQLSRQPWERPASLPALTQAASPAVDLGQPGLSFAYAASFGVSGAPYPADGQHLNRPNGMALDGAGNLFVVEEMGQRLLRFDAGGIDTLIVGQAGQPWYTGNLLAFPKDVALDGAGNLWVVIDSALKQFSPAGNALQTFPASSPWLIGSSNSRFRYPQGIAIDISNNRLFVSDTFNHRVQVYTLAGNTLTHSATIGETGVAGSDAGHFNFPAQVVVDGSGRLYVADADNFRVQRCTLSGSTWTCTTFHGDGSQGSSAGQLSDAFGLGSDAAGRIYIADGGNGRVKRCDSGGACTIFASGLRRPADVLADASGNVYVSDFLDSTVRKFDANGGLMQDCRLRSPRTETCNLESVFAGLPSVPYTVSNSHMNAPQGLAAAPDGSLYVVEYRGYRLIKLADAGQQLWAAGEAGIFGNDNGHFGDFWSGPEGNPAMDQAGRVYVTDTPNDRIQVFAADGSFHSSFGGTGTGNSQFDCPSGIAISPLNGDIVVADRCNQRVQVFDSAWTHKRTLGETGVGGSDDQHFRSPSGVAVDQDGALYVADASNQRVQKCQLSESSYVCTTFAGETGVFGDGFGHLHPVAVAVDTLGRLFAVDIWNHRVQVFDASGAYLTTLGGSMGSNNGQLRDPGGVAVDRLGNVYVADSGNHRLQKFTAGVSGWRQKNINGFGARWNTGVSALGIFNGALYAGTANWEEGGRVWRSMDGISWLAASELGFGMANMAANPAILDLTPFGDWLYAATGWGDGGGQVWRSSNGMSWSKVVDNSFGDAGNLAITVLAEFNGQFYAATNNESSGAEIWRSASGESGSWIRVVEAGFDADLNNNVISSLTVFGNRLYAAVENTMTGAELWRSGDGQIWSRVVDQGLGSAANAHFGSLAVFDGWLYLGTRNASTGGQIWRSQTGLSWQLLIPNGFADRNNVKIEALYELSGQLYAVTNHPVSGLEVWRSENGQVWKQIAPNGFGDSNNDATLWANATAGFWGNLYLGTWNWANGGEVWELLDRRVYLPVVKD